MPIFVIDQELSFPDVMLAETIKGMVSLICEEIRSTSSKDLSEDEIRSLMVQEISNQVQDIEIGISAGEPKGLKHKNYVLYWCNDCNVYHPHPFGVVEIIPSKPEDEWTPVV